MPAFCGLLSSLFLKLALFSLGSALVVLVRQSFPLGLPGTFGSK